MRTITTLLVGILAAALIAQPVLAAEELDEAEVERQIEEARQQIDEAAQVLKELSLLQYKHGGGDKRAMLGILLGGQKAKDGVIIDGVTPLSGAAEAGMQGGDKIVVIGDIDLGEAERPNQALSRFMKNVTPGEAVPLVYERDGDRVETTVVTKPRAELNRARRAMLGVLLGDPTEGGVEIVGVTPGGGAAAAGLQSGDKIVVIGDVALAGEKRPQRTLSAYMKKVIPGDAVDVTYLRDGESEEVAIVTRAEGEHIAQFFDKDFDFDFNFDFGGMAPGVAVKTVVKSNQLMAVDGDLAEYFDVDSGVVVIEPPADGDIKAGDVLLEIGGETVEDVKQAMTLLKSLDDDTEVRVKRRGRERDVTVDAADFAVIDETRVIQIHAPGAPDAPKVETVVEVKD